MSVKARLVLDLVMSAAFMAAFNPGVTGISLHEWLSLALIVPVFVHMVINWDWVTRIARKVVGKLRALTRVGFAVDVALFIATVAVMLSGLMVSRFIMPALHLSVAASGQWEVLHALSARAVIAVLLVHVGLHWRWFMRAFSMLDEPSRRPRSVAYRAADRSSL